MAAKQLSDGNADGAVLGQSSTDKVGFYGATAVVRRVASTAGALTTGATTAADIAAAVCDLRDQLATLGLVAKS